MLRTLIPIFLSRHTPSHPHPRDRVRSVKGVIHISSGTCLAIYYRALDQHSRSPSTLHRYFRFLIIPSRLRRLETVKKK